MKLKAIKQPYYRTASCGDGCCSWGEYKNVYLNPETLSVYENTGYSEYRSDVDLDDIFDVVETLPELDEYEDGEEELL